MVIEPLCRPSRDFRSTDLANSPIYYIDPNTNKPYILIVGRSQNKSNPSLAIIKYDIEHNEYHNVYSVDDQAESTSLSYEYFMDKECHRLYITECTAEVEESEYNFVCNLNDGGYEQFTMPLSESQQLNGFHHCVNNRLYKICSNHQAFTFDLNQKKGGFKILQPPLPGDKSLCYTRSIFIPSLRKTMVLEFETGQMGIWTLDHEKNEWILSDIEIPNTFKSEYVSLVLGVYGVVYLIPNYGGHKHGGRLIWCLDVVNKKWYKSKWKVPGDIYQSKGDGYWISTAGRYCYFYKQSRRGGDEEDCKLFRIDLFHWTPQELKDVIKERMCAKNGLIAFGYVRNKCETEYNYAFPDYLKRIVWKYANEIPVALTINTE